MINSHRLLVRGHRVDYTGPVDEGNLSTFGADFRYKDYFALIILAILLIVAIFRFREYIIGPSDWDKLGPREDLDVLTLLTCHPFGPPRPDRLLVNCERVLPEAEENSGSIVFPEKVSQVLENNTEKILLNIIGLDNFWVKRKKEVTCDIFSCNGIWKKK